MRHFLWSWQWFKQRATNRNFQEPIVVVDNQNELHVVDSRKELWHIAWKTYRSGGTTG